jgi:hypothetical protein
MDMADRMVGMEEIANFEACEPSGRFYGGDAGRKIGVVYNGVNWILKFPGPTRHLEGSVPSYTSAPMSEFLGSRVYAMLGIPVHETRLGVSGGKLVCACRDFVPDDGKLYEFRDLKNSLSDDEPGFSEAPSSGRGVMLADVRAAIHRIPELRGIPRVGERFWDMFVTDSFIRNIDRNNTNWGILTGGGRPPQLAPVYDNGSSFFNKRTLAQIDRRLADDDLIRQDVLDVRSCYTDDTGGQIAPLKYIASGQDEECNQALARFVTRFAPDAFDCLLDSIPGQMYGITIMPDAYREYHRKVLRLRYENVFLPAWGKIGS